MDGTQPSTTVQGPGLLGVWPHGINVNLDLQGMNGAGGEMSTGDTNSGSNSQTQSLPTQTSNLAMAGNVFLGASTPRGGF